MLAPIGKAIGTLLESPNQILPCGTLGRSLDLPIAVNCRLPEPGPAIFNNIPIFCINWVPTGFIHVNPPDALTYKISPGLGLPGN